MLIRYHEGEEARDLRVVVRSARATVDDLVRAISPAAGEGGVTIDGTAVDRSAALAGLPVPDGTEVRVGTRAGPRRPPAGRTVQVVGGLDAGRALPLAPATVSVGRAPDNVVVVHDSSVSRHHCSIHVRPDGGLEVTDLGSGNGTYVSGRRLREAVPTPVDDGAPVECGGAIVVVREYRTDDRPAALGRWTAAGSGQVPFYRQPRHEPHAQRVTLAVPVLSDAPAKPAFYVVSLLLPLAMAGVMLGLTHFKQPTYALFVLLSPVLMGLTYLDQRRRRRKSIGKGRRRFHDESADFRRELVEACAIEEAHRRQIQPDLAELVRWAEVPSVRLWERRRDHPGFGQVTLGTGDLPWQPSLDTDDVHDDVAALLESLGVLRAVPVTTTFAPGTVVGIAGPRDMTLPLARSVVVQAATLHGPADLSLAVMAEARAADDWDWVKWLPHAALADDPESRLVVAGGNIGERLSKELHRLPADHLVLAVLDAEHLPDSGHGAVGIVFRGARPAAGIAVATSVDALPEACDPVVVLDPRVNEAVLRPRRGSGPTFSPLGASAETATHLARTLARYRDPERSKRVAQLPEDCRLVDLLGLAGEDAADLVAATWERAGGDGADVPVGVSPEGPVVFDLTGPFPNFLAIGGAGSGLSELVRTITVAVGARESPEAVNLVLVGPGLAGLDVLPHVVATVTDPDEAAVAELASSLEHAFQSRASAVPPPQADAAASGAAGARQVDRIVVVVDDLVALASAAPRATEQLLRLLRQRRGEGIHLVATASRITGPLDVLWQLDAVRALLRMPQGFDAAAWLGVPEQPAGLGDLRAGSGLLAAARGDARRVQFASTYRERAPAPDPIEVHPFGILTAGRLPAPASADPTSDLTVLCRVVRAACEQAGIGRPPSLKELLAERPAAPAAELPELLGCTDIGALEPATAWRERSPREHLRVPIGTSPEGTVVELDLKEAARGGMGPHGLVVGMTGSGKSELLRTLVLTLAATHAPEALNLMLVDFKGGATFQPMTPLPHVAGVVTNLQEKLDLVERARQALEGELRRRQSVLSEAGAPDVFTYQQRRESGQRLDPLPALLVVIDEWVELLNAVPDFVEVLVQIGRIGRSVGVHLLLASQQLEEGKLRGLDKNVRYRMALHTETSAESRAAIGVADATSLPIPGHAILKVDEVYRRLRVAYGYGRYRGAWTPAASGDAAGEAGTLTVSDVCVARLAGGGACAHQIWLPPLPPAVPLDWLLGELATTEERGLHAAAWPGTGRLVVPLGLLDRPAEQRQTIHPLDFSGPDGNLAVVGAPQSGKSTLLRTAVMALALTHTPTEVQCYVVDLGGGVLASLDRLPHVGAVATRREPELVRRILNELERVMEEREELFKKHQIDSVAAFRALRSAGELLEEVRGDVFLVIDGWATFRQEFEALEPVVATLAARGLSFGLHLLLASGRWADYRASLLDNVGGRLELRLNNPADSQIDRRVVGGIPRDAAGRAVTPSRHLCQVALPRIDGAGLAGDLSAAYLGACEQARSAWPAEPAPPIRPLPRRFTSAHLAALVSATEEGQPGRRGVPVGVRESDMGPAFLDLTSGDPHFVVLGDGESGKTTFLSTYLRGLAARDRPEDSRIVLVDYRRTLLGVVPDSHLEGYAGAAPAAQEALSRLHEVLVARLPGAEVTTEQLRNRSWWSGPEYCVAVDDYDLVATSGGNPLQAIVDMLPMARDVGLHVVLARRVAGAAKALFEPVLARLRDVSPRGLVLSGDRQEGPLLGPHKASEQPPGRGLLVARGRPAELIQVALLDEG